LVEQSSPPPPPNWGADSLSDHLRAVHQNQFAVFVHRASEYGNLAEIDRCFLAIIENWDNPPNYLESFLFVRSHVAYRGACGHAISGAASETYPLIRCCLEYAGYAFLIHRKPDQAAVWLKRHEDKISRKAAINSFSGAKVLATIEASNPNKGQQYRALYEHAIDLGAHPNIQGLATNMEIVSEEQRQVVQLIHLHADGTSLRASMLTTAQAGLCALAIFEEIFPERFKQMGISEKLAAARPHR